MRIPALDRGVRILDYLIRSIVSRRYSDIRQTFSPISDASLNRLLKTLVSCGYVAKDVNGRYCVSGAVREWKEYLGGGLPAKEIIDPIIEELANELNESAAFAILHDGRVEVLSCANIVDSFAIVQAGSFLTFEADHAAVIAILDALPEKACKELIASPYSTISSRAEYETALETVKQDSFYSDKPASRLGMNRLAVQVEQGDVIGSLFLCAPTERKEKFLGRYVRTLNLYRDGILQRLEKL